MKKRRRADLLLVLCGILIWFLTDAVRIRAAAAEALVLCGKSVVPALFPFLVISSLLISLGFGEWISPYLAGLMTPLFRLPGISSSAFLLGLVGGYPIGAQTAAELYRENLLTREETQRLLTFCNNSNPVFLISVLGSGIFGSVRTGIWLWLIHLLSALLVGIFFRGHGKTASRQHAAKPLSHHAVSFPSAFVTAVRGSAGIMLSVCAFVVFFYVLASPLSALSSRLGPVLTGVLELFSLTPQLTPDRFGLVLAAGCTGWGGLSVLCQTAAVLDGTDLSLRPCFFGKLLQGILSAFLAMLLAGYIMS